MKYLIKAGTLYPEQQSDALAKIENILFGPDKKITLLKNKTTLRTTILDPKIHSEDQDCSQVREYVLLDAGDHIVASGDPGYAQGDDPAVTGWPLCRIPRVDHAQITIDNQNYLLTMHNNQNYSLSDPAGSTVLQILHRGLSGGWTLDTSLRFSPELLCGLMVFCRYIEQENEFLTV